MEIVIIGAGQIGGILTRWLTELGHEVYVANSRGPASLADLAREAGAKPVLVREAARAGEVVVVTIPEGKICDLLNLRPMVRGDRGWTDPEEPDGR